MRLDSDHELEVISDGLWGDVVRIIPKNICDPCLPKSICNFLSISDEYLRQLVYRFILVSLNTATIPEEVTFQWRGGIDDKR